MGCWLTSFPLKLFAVSHLLERVGLGRSWVERTTSQPVVVVTLLPTLVLSLHCPDSHH